MYCIPVKGKPKKNGGLCLISVLCQVNNCYQVHGFKPDTCKTVGQLVEEPDLVWGVCFNLESWFQPLVLSPEAKRWAMFLLSSAQAEGHLLQTEALPISLKSSPLWAHRLYKAVMTRRANKC